MKVIITAAGLGSRLGRHTDHRPKCLLEVAGASLLQHQLQAFADHGLGDIVIVRGHAAERIDVPGVRFIDNPRYAETNVLYSLMCAAEHMTGGFVSTYSDILFESELVADLLACPHDVAIVGDTAWRGTYECRDQHPTSEAEKVVLDDAGRVRRIGKHGIDPDAATAEFIGLMKCSAAGARRLPSAYRRLHLDPGDQPIGQAAGLERALLSDFLQHLVLAEDLAVHCVAVAGGWREIDTPQDLDRARRAWRSREPCS